MEIRPIKLTELEILLDHLTRHFKEYGVDGVIAHPYPVGMGIENEFRGQGFGKKLMKTAIEWSKQQKSLSWIDLNVFAHNQAAINLYKSFGFIEIGRVPDRIRLKELKIEDLHLTLSLSGSSF